MALKTDNPVFLLTFWGKQILRGSFGPGPARKTALGYRGDAMVQFDWKFVRAVKPKWPKGRPPVHEALYNLKQDPGETENLIEKHPEMAAMLAEKLKKTGQPKNLAIGGISPPKSLFACFQPLEMRTHPSLRPPLPPSPRL